MTTFEKIKIAGHDIPAGFTLVINITKSEGEFQGFKYSNMILETLSFDSALDVLRVRREKVKKAIFDVSNVHVGDFVSFSFDRFGNIQEIKKK